MSASLRRLLGGLGGAAASLPTTSLAQTIGSGPADGLPWLRVISALALCLLLGAGAILALRFRNGGLVARPAAGERKLVVLERVRLNAQLEVALLDCEGQRYLLAASGQGCSLVAVQSEGSILERTDA